MVKIVGIVLVLAVCAIPRLSRAYMQQIRRPLLPPEFLRDDAETYEEKAFVAPEESGTVIPMEEPETVRPVTNGTSGSDELEENFAVFGLPFRPVFPEDTSPSSFGGADSIKSPESPPPIDVRPVGEVDINLAQIASINSGSGNAVSANFFVSKSGINCSCGKSNWEQRIVNGEPVKINELPWTVALYKKNWFGFYGSRPFCGGTLINNKYVITASHCVDSQTATGLKVRLHEEDLLSTTENDIGFLDVSVETIIMHPEYNRRNIDNDIALLKLKADVDISDKSVYRPVCIPASADADYDGCEATVAGWGATSSSGGQSSKLRKVDVPIISLHDCRTKTKYGSKITKNMLCAGYLEKGGKDACQGDSGGPLVVNKDGRHTLVGVVSWGYGCARPKSPGVYARVSRYGDWILSNTKGAEWCHG